MLAGVNAFAGTLAEFATTPMRRSEAPAPAPVVTTDDEVSRLIGSGRVARVSSHDAQYTGRKSSKQCRVAWNSMRAAPVTRRPAAATDYLISKAVAAGISEKHIKRTLATYFANRDSVPNQRFVSVIDYNKHSTQKRMYTIELATGNVKSYHVAAGANSDPDGNGYATRFSNVDKSHKSSLGCVLAAGEYYGAAGRSLMMHGFDSDNNISCERSTVIHAASYAGAVPGRSQGCPAVQPKVLKDVLKEVGGGGLVCSFFDGEDTEARIKRKKNTNRAPARRSSYVRRRR